jgi:hypothetical protein
MRNYYSDYSQQFNSDIEAHRKPQLSPVMHQGVVYCISVLSRTAIFSPAGVKTQFAQWSTPADIAYLMWRCRRNVLISDYVKLIEITNAAAQDKISTVANACRPFFLDVDFSPVDTIFAPIETDDVYTPASVESIATSMNVKMATASVIARMLNDVKLSPASSAGVVALQPVSLRNSLLPTILQAMLVEHSSGGAEYAGVIAKKDQFEQTPAPIQVTGASYYRFNVYRKLARSTRIYLPNWEYYVTALSDFCRLLEVTTLAAIEGSVEKALQSTDRHTEEILHNGIILGSRG